MDEVVGEPIEAAPPILIEGPAKPDIPPGQKKKLLPIGTADNQAGTFSEPTYNAEELAAP